MLRVSVFALAIACASAAHADEAPSTSPPRARPAVEINLPLSLDGRYLGDIPVTLNGNQASFDAVRFLDLLGPEIDAATLAQIKPKAKAGRLTPEDATIAVLIVRYDTAQQQIDVSVPMSARARRVIQIQGESSTKLLPVISPAMISAFLNIGANLEYIWESPDKDDHGAQPFQGYADLGGRIGGDHGVAFISRQSFDAAAGQGFERNQTTLFYDDPSRMLRIEAGDLDYRGTSFQGLPRLAGIGIERYFQLEPNYVYRPIAQDQFEIDQSATVDIQVNGVTVRQMRLDPGRYDLRNLPLSQGSNNVDIVIRDASGRVQTLSTRRFFDINLLGEGITDFSANAGVRSNFSSNGITYTKSPAATGFVLHGFSPVFTAGGDAQFDDRGGTVGASFIWATPLGIWTLQSAASHRRGYGSGIAQDLGYRATGRFGLDGPSWSVDVDGTYYSPNFSTLADFAIPTENGILQPFSSSLSANLDINSQRWSITANAQYNRGRGAQVSTASAIAGINYNVLPRMTVGGFGTYSKIGSKSDAGGMLQITFRASRKDLVRATYDTARGEGYLSYLHSESNYVGDTTYELDLRRNAQSDYGTIDGSIYHVGNRYEATLEHDVYSTADLASDARIQTTRASAATSIVFADGQFGIGRPVQESFAIISPHPTLKGKTITIDPSEQGYRARTDYLGPAVVPDVNAYGNTFLYYDVKDLPLGYDLGPGDFPLRPPLYSGYRLTVGSDATLTVLAQVTRDGEPLSLIGGKFYSLDHPKDEPVPAFTNRNGRLAATGLRPGRYRLELDTNPIFRTEVVIKKGDSNLVKLGDIRIVGP